MDSEYAFRQEVYLPIGQSPPFLPININQGYVCSPKSKSKSESSQITLLEESWNNYKLKNSKNEVILQPAELQYFQNLDIALSELVIYKRYGHWTMFSGYISKKSPQKARLVLLYRNTVVGNVETHDPRFLFFKGSVPLSISLICRHPKQERTNRRLEDDIRLKFDLKSPGKKRMAFHSKFVQKSNISLNWTFNKGEKGLQHMGSVKDIRSPILGIFKLKYSLVLVVTTDKLALVYGKSYNEKGNFEPVVITSSDLNRFFSKTDKLLECCICNKEFLLVKYQPYGLDSKKFISLENQEEDRPEIFHFMLFRISKLAKLMMVDDSWEKMENDADRRFEKFHVRLNSIIDKSSGSESEEYLGFLIKFYTFEGDKAILNFWKLDKFGKFTNKKVKFLVGQNLKPVQESSPSLIKDIQQGFGYDFVTFSDGKIFRIVYNLKAIFNANFDSGQF